jgi:hypothetical protein
VFCFTSVPFVAGGLASPPSSSNCPSPSRVVSPLSIPTVSTGSVLILSCLVGIVVAVDTVQRHGVVSTKPLHLTVVSPNGLLTVDCLLLPFFLSSLLSRILVKIVVFVYSLIKSFKSRTRFQIRPFAPHNTIHVQCSLKWIAIKKLLHSCISVPAVSFSVIGLLL